MRTKSNTDRDDAADRLFAAPGEYLPGGLFDFCRQSKDQDDLSNVLLRLTDDHGKKASAAMLRDIAEVVRLTIKIVEDAHA